MKSKSTGPKRARTRKTGEDGSKARRRERPEESAAGGQIEQDEIRVQQRTEELSNKNAELHKKQRFMERTLAAQERDRKLVAYEIHDTFLQDVIGALLFLDAINEDRGGADEENAGRLKQARALLQKCIGEARRMISGLRPLIIDEQGIVGSIEYLVNEFNGRGLDIRLTHSMKTERLAADLESTVFRIVQEALVNLERHSQTTRGDVKITRRGSAIRVEVRDDGIGFDPDAVAEGHYGLEGLRERARLAGGSACVHSAVGKGTTVVVDLPLVSDPQQRAPADR